MMLKRIIAVFLWTFLSSGLAHAVALQSVEVRQHAGKTSLFFSLSEPVPYKVFTLVNPNRVVVDFENTHLMMNVNKIHVNPQVIKKVRSGHPYPGTLRLVFEMRQTVITRTDRGSSHAHYPHQFRVDLAARQHHVAKQQHPVATEPMPIPPTVTAPTPTPTHISTPTPAPALTPAPKSTSKPKSTPTPTPLPVSTLQPIVLPHAPNSLRPVVIVLDAGHGGKDPGAHGPHRIVEKDIVFAMAKRLKALIDAEPGMKAVLTRQGDYYMPLRQRLNLARRENADLFVSIHADAFHNPQSSGVSVFALSQNGATSEAARWLAEKENYSELGGG